MNIRKDEFGRLGNGTAVTRFFLENESGISITAMDYGANLLSVKVPGRSGSSGEVTLGFDSLAEYEGDHPYFGATIGRYANRISNASFSIKGKNYRLYSDEEGIHLHGGKEGFDRKMWDAEIEADSTRGIIRFRRTSPDGEEHYPGNLVTTVSFTLTEHNELYFTYEASADAATPINLTNHTYWNLAAPGANIEGHLLTLPAEKYLEIDNALVPTGGLTDVEGTAFDFRTEKPIGRDFKAAGGYDHCFVISGRIGELRPAAVVKDPQTGRCMSIDTTQPAIQLYTANMLEDTTGRNGEIYRMHGALCLETGGYNNAVNIQAFPTSILKAGEVYSHTTRHTFWAEKGEE